MPSRKEPLINNYLYHIIVKRIGNNLLFMDTNDYYRGIFSIYEFNDSNPVDIFKRRKQRKKEKEKTRSDLAQFWARSDLDQLTQPLSSSKRDKLVEVLCFCLMPNHIHLLLRQLQDSGISRFIHKFGTGYAGYFKEKHNIEDSGYFFQGRFKSVGIKTDGQLISVFNYIHINPISLIEPGWKENEIKDLKKALKFLKEYKWSSYLDYIGQNNFSSVSDRNLFMELIGGEEKCKESIERWIKHKKEMSDFKNLFLE